MKQDLPPAKVVSISFVLLIVAAIVSTSACLIPSRSEASATNFSPGISKSQPASGLNINTASRRELEKLPGIGQGMAERIISHRDQYGPFRRPEHLMMVRGISDRKFRALRAMIVVE